MLLILFFFENPIFQAHALRPTINIPNRREEGHERVRIVPWREACLVALRVLRLALRTILQ